MSLRHCAPAAAERTLRCYWAGTPPAPPCRGARQRPSRWRCTPARTAECLCTTTLQTATARRAGSSTHARQCLSGQLRVRRCHRSGKAVRTRTTKSPIVYCWPSMASAYRGRCVFTCLQTSSLHMSPQRHVSKWLCMPLSCMALANSKISPG